MGPLTRTLKIGIIGFGPFAQFLAKTMIKQGHLLTATSRSDHSGHQGVNFFRDMEEFMGLEHDVILICTSILSASEVIKSIPFHRLKKPTLFADVLSVKEYPRQLLLQFLLIANMNVTICGSKEVPEDSDLVCTHPMFGPESGRDGWRDLTFMYERVRVRDDDLCSSFLTIFECEGCKMLEMSCEEHDRLAAESQFLTHTIGRYSEILSEMEIMNTPIDTKGFEKLVQVKETTMRDSFDLYSGLFIHNRFAKQQLKNLESAVQRVKGILEARMNKGDEQKCDQ
ncbi:NAD(P)-binding domain-containing protein [Cynara cardunculus var. scolymus]|uniref:NAD(P)-binding domain-containing protein n=1 Tax=Cynara cardunculus var. scolymus TaxID=59895 RepID=A0A103YJ34_CYNCS|nr:NAD(P)-binding domain-containing protein [Cynara cardunculus var. scolymus]